VNAIVQYAGSWRDEAQGGWNRFWFTPADPATLGLVRVFTGWMLLYTHLAWSFDLLGFMGPRGRLSLDFARSSPGWNYSFSHFYWFESPAALWIAHGACLVVLALFALGLFSRVTAVLAWLITLSYAHRAQGALFGLDQINVLLATYVMLGPSGDAYSLDRAIASGRAGHKLPPAAASVSANIAVRLIQLHMCVVYLFAACGKLMGVTWWNGTAIWGALANYEYQTIDMTWLASFPLLINVLTHVTVVWELSYSALVWPRLTRPLVLLLAVPLHLGIALCMGMITFGLVMLIGNLAFVPPHVVRAVLERKGTADRGARIADRNAAGGGKNRHPKETKARRGGAGKG
jgi:hypothetical protein